MKNDVKILIIRLSALGDTIHTIPLVAAIKKAYPESEIGWVVEDKAHQFVCNNPLVDKCYELPRKQWKKRGLSFKNLKEYFEIIKKINDEHYDIVIDTQQLFKSASIMAFLNIKRKITHQDGREFSYLFANEFVKSSRKQFDVNFHVVKRNLEFANHLGIKTDEIEFVLPPVDEQAKEKVQTLLATLDTHKPIVTISPATTWDNKHWNKDYWIEVINAVSMSSNIVMTGSLADSKLIDSIIAKAELDNILNLAGKTNLMELSEVFSHSDVVISPDSGSAHIAWATGKPAVITIFCATSKERTGPFGDKCFSLAPSLDCSPCMKRKCKASVGKNACCSDIKPSQIINIVNNLLQ